MRTLERMFLLLGGLLLTACAAPEATEYPKEMDMTTWSIVGVDPETGDVGVAVSSCVTRFGDAVAALVPGKGAAATQAGFNIDNPEPGVRGNQGGAHRRRGDRTRDGIPSGTASSSADSTEWSPSMTVSSARPATRRPSGRG